MKKFTLLIVFLLLPIQVFALSSEVHITKDGKAVLNSVKVMQLAGQTIFARIYWGDAFVRITIKTNNNSVFYRATGEKTTLSEISIDDILNLEGELEPGGNQLVIIPKVLRNTSVEKEKSVLKGKVISVDVAKNSFVLNETNRGNVTVLTGTTTEFIKGSRSIDLARLKVGDIITQTSGDYDYKTKSLAALAVIVYVDLYTFKPKIHEGIINSINGSVLPTDLSIRILNTNYTVFLNKNSSIINKDRKPVTLSRFEVGDRVRIYGAIREVDEPFLDAEVLRNTDL